MDGRRDVDDINGVLTEAFHVGGAVGAAHGFAGWLKTLTKSHFLYILHQNKFYTYLGVHEHERQLSRQFSAQGTQEEFHLDGIRDDNSKALCLIASQPMIRRIFI